MAEFALFALFVLAALLGTLLLWAAIEGETDGKQTMERSDAERAARQDTDDDRR